MSIYAAIDLKSFYASVECVERNLDPLNTHLVVADGSRTEKTICLAVSPSLKALGISGRARLFEVVQKVRDINKERYRITQGYGFKGSSYIADELEHNPALKLDYLVAQPRMSFYMDYSTKIYNIYRKYIDAQDIHVYSIDEVFIDLTSYLRMYKMSPHDLVMKMILDVYQTTGITATAGIGTNMYLAKVAMDIVAKHIEADKNGVRIAELDELSYRRKLWEHKPLTDFWRVGRGYSKKLEANGMYTMGDVALKSIEDEDLLFKLFGINAELLIDHAWGIEPCTIKEIKAYKPSSNSLSRGQVLASGYPFEKGKIIVLEMAELLSLDLVEKGLVCSQVVLSVSYDYSSDYDGDMTKDWYGRVVPKPAHGSFNFKIPTSSTKEIMDAFGMLYERIINRRLRVQRFNVTAANLQKEDEVKPVYEQMNLFTDYEALQKEEQKQKEERQREMKAQKALIEIKKKYGKNAVIKGMNLQEGATTVERNEQIGGHKA